MLFRRSGHAVLTLHDRHSRLLLAVRSPSKAAAPIASALTRLLAPLPPPWRQTVTFDNGTEFARHHQLHAHGIQTFFWVAYDGLGRNGVDPHAPWPKGGIENAIGRLRRTLPRKTDLATLAPARFTELVQAPRKCPYQTPAEVFWDQPLRNVNLCRGLIEGERTGQRRALPVARSRGIARAWIPASAGMTEGDARAPFTVLGGSPLVGLGLAARPGGPVAKGLGRAA